MQYLRGWTALRNDPNGVSKVLWASLLILSSMCIPVLGQLVVIGWNALMLRRAVSGQDAPLPRMEWDTDYLMKLINAGFKGFLANLLWAMPFVAIMMCSYCCIYIGLFGMIGGVAVGESAGGDAGGIVSLLIGLVLFCLAIVFVLVVAFAANVLQTVAVLRAEVTDDLNAALRFKEVLHMARLVMKEALIGIFVMMMVWTAISFIVPFTLYLGLFPGIVVMQIIMTYLRAELYRVYLEKGGEPLPVGPLTVEGGDAPIVGQPAGHPPAQF